MSIERVFDGPLVDPVTDEPVPATRARTWTLTFRRGSEVVGAQWNVEERVLQLAPHVGWSSHFIGRVKRSLIALGDTPPSLRG